MWRQVTFRRLPGTATNASASVRRYAHNVMIGDNIDTALENMSTGDCLSVVVLSTSY